MLETRAEFPVLDRYTWLMSNARGPMPRRVSAALCRIATLLGEDPLAAAIEFEQAAARARQATATMLNARPAEIAFFANTTTAITTIAHALPFQPGANVVIAVGEFPGLVYPWLALQPRGLSVIFAPLDDQASRQISAASLTAAADEKTRAIVLSHVDWVTGARRDLAAVGRFCYANGIYLIVDAAQSMGLLPLDVEAAHISALASRGDKWLLSASGLSCLYVREELHDQLVPGLLGYHGMAFGEEFAAQPGFDYPIMLRGDAGRYELGGPNEMGLVAWATALEWLLDLRITRIAEHALLLADKIATGVTQLGYKLLSPASRAERGGIVAFQAPNFEQVQNLLWEHGIITGADEQSAVIQASPHFFNSAADVQSLLETLPQL